MNFLSGNENLEHKIVEKHTLKCLCDRSKTKIVETSPALSKSFLFQSIRLSRQKCGQPHSHYQESELDVVCQNDICFRAVCYLFNVSSESVFGGPENTVSVIKKKLFCVWYKTKACLQSALCTIKKNFFTIYSGLSNLI